MSDTGSSSNAAQELIQPSINQSVALAVQSAVDLMRNINTIETTVIGVASASWLANPAMSQYKDIIENATKNITFAVDNLAKVGSVGAGVLKDLKPD